MKKSLKGLLSLAVAGVLSLGSMTAYAGEWKQDGRGWWWQEDDGSYVVNQWKWLDGDADGVYEKYHFNAEGYLDVNTVLTDTDGTQVQVNADGAKLKSNNEVSVIRNDYEIKKSKEEPDETFKDMFNYEKNKSVKDASEYMSEYNDLKPGVVFVYDNIGSMDVLLLELEYATTSLEHFSYYAVVADTETYHEKNYYADNQGQKYVGKICAYKSGDFSSGNSLRVFIYE